MTSVQGTGSLSSSFTNQLVSALATFDDLVLAVVVISHMQVSRLAKIHPAVVAHKEVGIAAYIAEHRSLPGVDEYGF